MIQTRLCVSRHKRCGSNSAVEYLLPKQKVAGSNPVSRSNALVLNRYRRISKSLLALPFCRLIAAFGSLGFCLGLFLSFGIFAGHARRLDPCHSIIRVASYRNSRAQI